MDFDEKFELIKRNTQEIVGEDELKELLKERNMKVYLGTAITGRPHIGYFVPMIKISDFLKAGSDVTIMLADLHALLDDLKTPFELLDARYKYYKDVIKGMLISIGTDITKLHFKRGSEFELNKEYSLDVYKMASIVSLRNTQKAAAEVVRFGENPRVGGFIYPIMQALDEVYLNVDAQYGGVDQRKILMFARENLPKIGYKSRIEIMTPMIPGLSGKKMSSSEENSKIDLLDDDQNIKKKVNSAFCPEGVVENNGILAFVKNVVMILKKDKNEDFIIKRPEKFGGDIIYRNYSDLEKDFVEKQLHPMDLKIGVAEEIIKLIKPIREIMKDKEEIIKKAYP